MKKYNKEEQYRQKFEKSAFYKHYQRMYDAWRLKSDEFAEQQSKKFIEIMVENGVNDSNVFEYAKQQVNTLSE